MLLVFRLLSKYKINYFFHNKASIFSNPNWIKRSFPKKVKAFLSKDRRSIIEYFQNMFLRIFPQKLFGISDVPICFKDCKAADTSISLNKKLIGKNTKIILSHHRDYDLYLKYKNNDGEKYKPDAVLLDQNFGFHNDLVKTGEFMDPKKWYESLKVFFDFLKNKYSINITICAHPRSNGEINSFISDYPIIKNKTAQLVKNCSFVICQSSTAINFAALFKKPMIFLYNHIAIKNKKTKRNHAAEVDFFASTFNKRPISIENLKDFNLKNEIKIDENSYDRFIAKHIKSWGPDKMVHEMIMNLL